MRSRRRYPVALLLVLAAIVLSAVFVSSAAALRTFTQAQFGIGPCDSCHGGAFPTGVHAVPAHAGFIGTCATCHTSGTGTPPAPPVCGACHGGVAAILTTASHVTQGCGTTNGCHLFSAAPTLTSFTPTSGAVGTVITLTGTQFTGVTTVTIGGISATAFTVDTPKSMRVTVPAGAITGPIIATTTGGSVTSAQTFTVTAQAKPRIVKLSPTAGKRRATVTITGRAFGAKRATSVVKFGKVKATKYVSWSASRIKVAVPAKAKIGKVTVSVRTSAGLSNTKPFRVRR